MIYHRKNKVKTEFLPWKHSMFGVCFQTVGYTKRGPGWLLWDKYRAGDRSAVTCAPCLGRPRITVLNPVLQQGRSEFAGNWRALSTVWLTHCLIPGTFWTCQESVAGWHSQCWTPWDAVRAHALGKGGCKYNHFKYFNQLLPAFIPANAGNVPGFLSSKFKPT